MMMKLILFACFVPLPIILYFVLRNETKPKKNLVLGVTLPADARMDSAVEALCLGFRRQNALLTLLITLLAIPPFFLTYDSVVLTYFMTWLPIAIAAYFILYAATNKKLKLRKATNGWYGEAAGLALLDVKLAAMPTRRLSILWFIPPMVIGIIPAVYTAFTRWGTDEFWPMLVAYGSLAAMVVLFCLLYRIIYRQRAEVVDENTPPKRGADPGAPIQLEQILDYFGMAHRHLHFFVLAAARQRDGAAHFQHRLLSYFDRRGAAGRV